MAEVAAPGAAGASASPSAAPYQPSWVNTLNDWFERLPGPTWLAYLAAMAAGVGFMLTAPILEPNSPPIPPIQYLYYGALPFAVLGLIASLDRTAGRALATLRPLLRLSDDEVATVRRALTVAPARPALAITILAVVVTPIGYVMDPIGAGVEGYGPVGLGLRWAWEALVTAVFLILVHHTFRQLRLIGRLHESISTIDLFDQSPLYALSSMTSLTAIGLILLLVPSLFLIPSGAGESYILFLAGWYGSALGVAAIAFFVPLRGIHDRLVAEKRRLQAETGARLSTALASIHDAVDSRDAGAIDARAKSLAALVAARDLVNRAPTWPWSGGALTGFLSAIALPIVLFLIQRLLSQLI